MLVVGTDDGVIRVWRNYKDQDHCSVVATWRALPCQSASVNSGLIFDWQDNTSLVQIRLFLVNITVDCWKFVFRSYVGCYARVYCSGDSHSH